MKCFSVYVKGFEKFLNIFIMSDPPSLYIF